ncbi:SWI/SNF chromatin-remodeling complex subunit [Ophidiomyces ophidiicola]|uniref:SWI/SNF chromatin-remodeling complex subunit n=1 Tax=Ophidiomyces ophidiicola TaxID=1387563 RepID=UPI0020C55F6B|nr:SWI/SNF chromatin-remodeling complex subunit [Ophidiomyces ophidiicola]KAI1940750.1 SWI/SNF chromatin-remodeling complex subunit [Ophidiomyces ophidiicola]KAI2059354.1 SWI/SNF chromatin-remodeling complex subunit [Ophidiomyces ophidiicola]KAI2087469.1 SWI/SNF chromatin-remodeling complex subunit [Ophidiomyces ophidiicola]
MASPNALAESHHSPPRRLSDGMAEELDIESFSGGNLEVEHGERRSGSNTPGLPSDGKEKLESSLSAVEAHNEEEEPQTASAETEDDPSDGPLLPRKRSRTGSLKRSTSPPVELVAGPRETPLEKVLLEQYLHREWLHTALAAGKASRRDILQEKRAERDYYLQLQHERQMNPAALFGTGYEGFGNARTDIKSQHPQLLYPSNRRKPGGRKSRDIRVSRKEMEAQADQAEDLVPIRLDIDWDKVKIRDTFTWNLHDRLTSPEVFAEKLVEDFGLPLETCGSLVRQIAQSIQDQITDYHPHVFIEEEPLDPHLPYFAYKNDEMRVSIKLNITIGQHTLVDQFEWDINNPYNSPEEFAAQMARDLAFPGEFVTAIAHSIREQSQLFTRSLYIISHPFDGRPIEEPDLKESLLPSPLDHVFRSFQSAKEYAPYLYELSEASLDKTEMSISRDQRRQKRSVNRRGGPALPDLKDRQRTIRTMIVSSVIPGAALSIEDSRLFKRSGTSRSRRANAQRDGLDESDESESDESSAGSPALSQLAQGTARTRNLRTASAIAQTAMRNHLARSATPETSSLHESRVAARRRDYREESSESPEKLIIRLKINPLKLRQFLKNLTARQAGYTGSPAAPAVTTPVRPAIPTPRAPMGPPTAQPGATPKRPTPSQLNGVVDAPHPPQPGVPGPPPPPWLIRGLNNLKRNYPRDSFEGTMRYTAVDPQSNLPLPNAATTHPGQKLIYKYFPRIRCHDCPGKLYTPGPALTVDNFEVHLKNRQHKERVEERHVRQARELGVASGSV